MHYQTDVATRLTTPKTLQWPGRERIGVATVALALLISSYFYVLPFGEIRLFSLLPSGVRPYELALVAFGLVIGLRYLGHLRILWQESDLHRSTRNMILIVWAGVIVTLILGEEQGVLASLRALRFTGFLLVASLLAVTVSTRRGRDILLGVMFCNVLIQSVLSFLQSLGYIPYLWPPKWKLLYGARPIGTLAPNHTQMGIVMLLGIAVAMVYVRSARFFLLRIICVLAIGIMCVSVVLLGSRTAMLGVAAYAVFSVLQRGRTAILRYAVLVLGIVLVVNFRGELLEEQVRDAFDERVVEVYERGGIEELSSYRLSIWRMFPETIKRHSWVLVTGSGFQNADPVIHGATAMHNNYLHVIVELGVIGFLIYANWLLKVYRSLRHAESQTVDTRGMVLAEEMKLAFMAILVTMLVSETLYAQAAMATLTGQITFLVYLAALGPNLTPREVTS